MVRRAFSAADPVITPMLYASLISLLSGCSALIFEVVWFNQAGLFLGRSVWTISIVVSAYMLGCACGTAWAGWRARRLENPYAALVVLQLIGGVSGALLVFLFPHLGRVLAPLFGPFLDTPVILNAIRLALAFVLLSVPCFCAGALLPLLSRTCARRAEYSAALSVLYGVNTLGALLGVLGAQFILIRFFGIAGTGWMAFACSCLGAYCAYVLLIREKVVSPERETVAFVLARMPLVLAFAAGFAFLAMEVAWFRFFTLFFHAMSLNFSLLLAMVLAGTCCGSISSGRLLRRFPKLYWSPGWAAFLCALFISVTYRCVPLLFGIPFFSQVPNTVSLLFFSLVLIFPVACLSGIYFILLSKQVHEAVSEEAASTGMLVTANTLGCMIGSLASGLVFIPSLGVEKTFLACACVYAACGIAGTRTSRWGIITAAAAIASLVLFPFGVMKEYALKIPVAPFWEPGMKRITLKEGAGETIQLVGQELLGRPYYQYLFTNSYSMSATTALNRRYMYYFSFLPLAVKPDLKRALVISYGIGNTADALLDEPGLERLDVVDVSKDIYDVSSLLYAHTRARDPLKDTRVKAYVEDGRFFLMTREGTYDLITGEPPPPKNEGIVNLYTKEFFFLIRRRLSPGGMVTYWLPVAQLRADEIKAICAAFSSVFPDCMLFAPVPTDWVMVGTNGFKGPAADVNAFKRLWFNDRLRQKLYHTGYMTPDQLAALFVIDGERLKAWIGSAPALEDNYPQTLSSELTNDIDPQIALLLSAQHSRGAFLKSRMVPEMFCDEIRFAAKRVFEVRNHLYRAMQGFEDAQYIGVIHACLNEPLLQEALLWALGSDYDALAIITEALKNNEEVTLERAGIHLAARAIFERDFRKAQEYYARMCAADPLGDHEFWYALRMYLLYAAGSKDEATAVAQEYTAASRAGPDRERRIRNVTGLQKWLQSEFK